MHRAVKINGALCFRRNVNLVSICRIDTLYTQKIVAKGVESMSGIRNIKEIARILKFEEFVRREQRASRGKPVINSPLKFIQILLDIPPAELQFGAP